MNAIALAKSWTKGELSAERDGCFLIYYLNSMEQMEESSHALQLAKKAEKLLSIECAEEKVS